MLFGIGVACGPGVAFAATRLLAVDNEMVVPVNKVVRMQVTGEGIIHSFSVPSFGIKNDAVAVPNAVHAEHEEHEAVEASSPEEHSGVRHEMKESAESHVDEMGHEIKGATNAVKSEHEAHEMNDR